MSAVQWRRLDELCSVGVEVWEAGHGPLTSRVFGGYDSTLPEALLWFHGFDVRRAHFASVEEAKAAVVRWCLEIGEFGRALGKDSPARPIDLMPKRERELLWCALTNLRESAEAYGDGAEFRSLCERLGFAVEPGKAPTFPEVA